MSGHRFKDLQNTSAYTVALPVIPPVMNLVSLACFQIYKTKLLCPKLIAEDIQYFTQVQIFMSFIQARM